jgi:hypothetical protein
MNGKLITELEKTDVSRLVATGWKPPAPVSVKAHDGKTDIYGLVFTPTNMDRIKNILLLIISTPARRAEALAVGVSPHHAVITRHWLS